MNTRLLRISDVKTAIQLSDLDLWMSGFFYAYGGSRRYDSEHHSSYCRHLLGQGRGTPFLS